MSRLLDASNKAKSVDKLVVLLGAVDCEVEFKVRPAVKTSKAIVRKGAYSTKDQAVKAATRAVQQAHR